MLQEGGRGADHLEVSHSESDPGGAVVSSARRGMGVRRVIERGRPSVVVVDELVALSRGRC